MSNRRRPSQGGKPGGKPDGKPGGKPGGHTNNTDGMIDDTIPISPRAILGAAVIVTAAFGVFTGSWVPLGVVMLFPIGVGLWNIIVQLGKKD